MEKKYLKRSKWDSIPRKASHKWIKIEIWRMEFGVKWCAWIPQWNKRPWKKLEVGIANPRSTKEGNITVSFISSKGRPWPKAECHLMVSWGWRRHSSTKGHNIGFSAHLLANHPLSIDGALLATSFSYPCPVDLLGAMRKTTGRFVRMHSGALDLEAKEKRGQGFGESSENLKETMNGLKNRSTLGIGRSKIACGGQSSG